MAGAPEIDFVAWREEFHRALELGESTSVPCDGCTACCRSYQFVHIGADESGALSRIDPALLAPAPVWAPGYVVMGYDEQGRCPMLGDHGCRIYEDRPRTCRVYDCRVYAAAGVEPDQPLIASRVAEWRFADDDGRRATMGRAAEILRSGAVPAEAAVNSVMEGYEPERPDGPPGRTSRAIVDSTPLTKRPDSSVE